MECGKGLPLLFLLPSDAPGKGSPGSRARIYRNKSGDPSPHSIAKTVKAAKNRRTPKQPHQQGKKKVKAAILAALQKPRRIMHPSES
jgi:hypothetical protein